MMLLPPLPPRATRVVGRGRGWGVSPHAPLAASLRRAPPTPDPSPPLRGGRGGEPPQRGFDESPQREFAPANYGTSAPIPTLDPELAKQLGFTTEEEDAAALARPPRNKMESLGVAATADALDALIRDGRPEFKGEDGQVKIWTPHRPPRPEKSEGGVRFVIKSEYEPKGDQPTAIAELVEGIQRHDRTQVLLGVTGSGKTYTMAKVIEATQRPALILAPNKTLAAQLYGEFKSFFPDNAVEYFVSYYDYYQPEAYVPRTDTYIEKDSSINEQIDRMRHSATRALLGARRRHHRGFSVVHLRYSADAQPASPLPLAGEGQGGGLSASPGFDESPQREFAPANYGTVSSHSHARSGTGKTTRLHHRGGRRRRAGAAAAQQDGIAWGCRHRRCTGRADPRRPA